jgi:hypothetical protein
MAKLGSIGGEYAPNRGPHLHELIRRSRKIMTDIGTTYKYTPFSNRFYTGGHNYSIFNMDYTEVVTPEAASALPTIRNDADPTYMSVAEIDQGDTMPGEVNLWKPDPYNSLVDYRL